MRAPAQTRLVAECATDAAIAAVIEEHGEGAWPDYIEYTEKVFPDTPAGLKRAAAWVRKTGAGGEGRVERETLRDNYQRYKRQYWYDQTYDVYHVYEEGGEWEYAEGGEE